MKFSGQDYQLLLQECLKKQCQFIDPHFIKKNELLTKKFLSTCSNNAEEEEIQWKRLSETVTSATVPDLSDSLINSYIISSMSNPNVSSAFLALSQNKNALQQVLANYDFENGRTSGLFCFHLWYLGQWHAVVVDDFVPYYKQTLLSTTSIQPLEFWPALVEKSLAKLLGSYEALEELEEVEILSYLTGCWSEWKRFEVNLDQTELFHSLVSESENKNIIFLQTGEKTKNGLLPNRTYVVAHVRMIDLTFKSLFRSSSSQRVPMVNILNPWEEGNWIVTINKDVKDLSRFYETAPVVKGQFWMHWNDVLSHFQTVIISHFENTDQKWNQQMIKGSWRGRFMGGGPGADQSNELCLNNPQYCLNLPWKTTRSSVEIKLSQISVNDSTNQSKTNSNQFHSIGFVLLRVDNNRKFRIHQLNSSCQPLVKSIFKVKQTIIHQATLASGRFVIIPATEMPNISTNYLLQVNSDEPFELCELTMDWPSAGGCWWFTSLPKIATRIIVQSLRNVDSSIVEYNSNDNDATTIYCLIECEKEEYRTCPVNRTTDGTYNWCESFLFYRTNSQRPIKISMVKCRYQGDDGETIGTVTLSELQGNPGEQVDKELEGNKTKDGQSIGILAVEFYSKDRIDFAKV